MFNLRDSPPKEILSLSLWRRDHKKIGVEENYWDADKHCNKIFPMKISVPRNAESKGSLERELTEKNKNTPTWRTKGG